MAEKDKKPVDEPITVSLMRQILCRLDDIAEKQDSTAVEIEKLYLMVENSNLRQGRITDDHERRIVALESDVACIKRKVAQ